MGSVVAVDDTKKVSIEILVEREEINIDLKSVETDELKLDETELKLDENELKLDEIEAKSDENVTDEGETVKKYRVVFVLGGPGGGKSTQCSNICKQIGFTHLSSGDLLRKASQSDAEHGPMIQSMIKEGESVPPELTMVILMKAIEKSGNDKFILDGFPRDEEIRVAFETATKTEPELVLFFDCSEEEREKRIMSRNQGRVDDNPESIRKRFKYFEEHTLPVVEYYRFKEKVYQIDASKTKEEVSETIKSLLTKTVIVKVEQNVEGKDEEDEAKLEQDLNKLKL